MHVEGVPSESKPLLAGSNGVSNLIGACVLAMVATPLILAFGLPAWLMFVLWPVEVIVIMWLMIPRIRRDTEKLRKLEASLLKPTCIDSKPVVNFKKSFLGPVFYFANPVYAEDFRKLNL
jgi:uncharacterized membrane protein YhdT